MPNFTEALRLDNTPWKVFRRSPGLFGSKFNTWMMFICFLLCFIFSMSFISGYEIVPEGKLLESISKIAEVGVTVCSQILGFLIAGFAILSSFNRSWLSKLTKLEYKASGLSHFQFLFYSLFNVFFHYVAFLALCVFISAYGQEGGLLRAIAHLLESLFLKLALVNENGSFNRVMIVLSFDLVSIWMVVILLKLRSFVWNVFSISVVRLMD